MKPSISGYTVVRNALSLDYPVELTIKSLLAGCDEVVVGLARDEAEDGALVDDGTWNTLTEWALKEPKLRIISQKWTNPAGDIQWFVKWINETRQSLRHEHQIMLDADEVFDPSGYDILRSAKPGSCFTMHRLNYWRDARHLIPHGRCCSHLVTRFGGSHLYMPSDEIYDGNGFSREEPEIRLRAKEDMRLKIHHLGFLRRREAMFKKCRVVLKAFFNGYDSRLEEAEKHPEIPWQDFCPFDLPLVKYNGDVPEIAREWLKERGAL